jgi:hypothetical protein
MGDTKRLERLHKVEKIPGMYHALKLISEYSFMGCGKDMNEYSGDKGKEIRRKGIRKISQVWELSDSAEKVLVQEWVEAEAKPLDVKEFVDGSLMILFEKEAGKSGIVEPKGNGLNDENDSERRLEDKIDADIKIIVAEEEQNSEEWKQKCGDLDEKGATLLSSNMVERGHIYLDVTDIAYERFHKSYKVIRSLRDILGIQKRDIRRGAPQSINDERALVVASLDRDGVGRKAIANHLGFKIYSRDNPSGSYPLVHKYVKVGKGLLRKLNELEDYLKEITGIEGENTWRTPVVTESRRNSES